MLFPPQKARLCLHIEDVLTKRNCPRLVQNNSKIPFIKPIFFFSTVWRNCVCHGLLSGQYRYLGSPQALGYLQDLLHPLGGEGRQRVGRIK